MLAKYWLLALGVVMHFDSPGLSDYYFIDPHWLYDVFYRVCTSSEFTSSRIDSKRVIDYDIVYVWIHM